MGQKRKQVMKIAFTSADHEARPGYEGEVVMQEMGWPSEDDAAIALPTKRRRVVQTQIDQSPEHPTEAQTDSWNWDSNFKVCCMGCCLMILILYSCSLTMHMAMKKTVKFPLAHLIWFPPQL